MIRLFDQAHGNPGNRALQRHAGIHHGHAAAAYRGHRGRTVRFQNLGDNPDRIGEILFRRQNRFEAPGGQVAMADISPATGRAGPHLADTVGREIVVQHEAVGYFPVQGFHPLLVAFAAKGR